MGLAAFPILSPSCLNRLSRSVTKEEVCFALRNMGPLKSPGPDGYLGVFYQKNWSLIGSQVTATVDGVIRRGAFPEEFCDALLIPIAKVEKPEFITQFRPISLLNVVFKLTTKVIVNRLKPILPKIISPTLASFIPGRQITDNIVIVEEVLHTMRSRAAGKKRMIMKIDLEKAYDRIRWEFLEDTLREAHIPIDLIRVILQCQSRGSTKLLWNEGLADSFMASRGVRQGDPLSPYLFVLCMERLTHLIQAAVDAGIWKVIIVGGVDLSHLFFTDDLLLFVEARLDQVTIISEVLDKFCKASGERVNFAKSSLMLGKDVPKALAKLISQQFGMPIKKDLGRYLGVPTSSGQRGKNKYQYLLEKIGQRLRGWQAKTLSVVGHVTLAKSALTSLQLYVM